ncbi:MAG: MoxR family ATPase [Methanobacteriota archaeon]|nr:MAG: MoxR family ATPase [Euryarchaeota archaeon]
MPEEPIFDNLLDNALKRSNQVKTRVVLKGQYKEAFDLLRDAAASQLTPLLLGPPGTGKTLIARYFAQKEGKAFEWMTFDESTKPQHLLGSFDPAITFKEGFVRNAFLPGPLTKMMVKGGVFFANELNRATEFTQNTLLEPMEERSVYLPRIGRIKADDDFFLISAANPADLAGTHRLSEALKDRIKLWIPLDYPPKSIEMEIVRANLPEIDLSDDILELIFRIIQATRQAREIEKPASVRAGIALAKLLWRRQSNGEIDMEQVADLAFNVLFGSVKFRAGIDDRKSLQAIIKRAITGT